MKFNFNGVKTTCCRAYMKLRKISPELALAGGIACGVAAVVVGCIASQKVKGIIDETREELNGVEKDLEKDAITVSEAKKRSFYIYKNAAWMFAKIYAPTVGLTMASVGLILTSHGILNKRYVGLSAAYTTLDGAFKDYRRRVAKLIGKDAERVLVNGGSVEKDIKVIDEEGNVQTQKGSNVVIQQHNNSPYEFDFNRFTAPGVWEPNADYIEMRLRNTQNYFNELLNARGHVFLNEVLDELNMQRTPAGAVCGWVKGCGDDYIDFGFWDNFKRDYDQDSDLCVKNVHLNFNCDGSIWDMI